MKATYCFYYHPRNRRRPILSQTIVEDRYTKLTLDGCIPITAIEKLMEGEKEITPEFVDWTIQLYNMYKTSKPR